MRAVVTVIGKDMVGILGKVATACAGANANVMDVTQSILQEYFVMVMIIDISALNCDIDELKEKLTAAVPEMRIHVMHEEIFDSMHRI